MVKVRLQIAKSDNLSYTWKYITIKNLRSGLYDGYYIIINNKETKTRGIYV